MAHYKNQLTQFLLKRLVSVVGIGLFLLRCGDLTVGVSHGTRILVQKAGEFEQNVLGDVFRVFVDGEECVDHLFSRTIPLGIRGALEFDHDDLIREITMSVYMMFRNF